MQTARVPGFTPTSSGFKFNNSFPAGIPVVNITIPGTAQVGVPVTIPIGDASNGVCGGVGDAPPAPFPPQPRPRVPPGTPTPPGGPAPTKLILPPLPGSLGL